MRPPDLLVVGANPAIDVYYCLDRFRTGEVNRVASVRSAAGGKANNLARVYRTLGGNPVTTGIAGGETGRRILAGLTEEGIQHEYVAGSAESRQTVTLVSGGTTTVLLEPGPPVAEGALDALAAKVAEWAPCVPAVAIVGSLPPGAPSAYVARLVHAVSDASLALVAVDASGEALRLAALAGPRIIKVNAREYESAFGEAACDRDGIERLYRELAGGGVEMLCLTDGARGAFVVTREDRFVVRTAVDAEVSSAGAGDAFLAGLLFSLRRGDTLREAACLASATAAATLEKVGAGFVEPASVEAALDRTRVLEAQEFFAESRS